MGSSVPSRCSLVAAAAVAAATPVRVILRRSCFGRRTIPATTTIRVRIFVTGTTIMLANTAGTLPIFIRAGIGTGRGVMAIMIAVESVPRLLIWLATMTGSVILWFTIRIWIIVSRTTIIPENTVGTLTIEFRTGIGNLLVVMTLMIVVESVVIE